MSMSEYLNPLYEAFEQNRNKEKAMKMKAYMKDKFEFYGIQSVERRKIFKAFLKNSTIIDYNQMLKIVSELWKHDCRECQYCAIDLSVKYLNEIDIDYIQFLEKMIVNRSWWDTVDLIASQLVGHYFDRFVLFKLKKSDEWINSENIWLQRTAIIFQLRYKDKTNFNILYNHISKCINSDEFFIQKAIGWALREYAKTNPESVIKFVENNQLKPLSKREALKHLN